MKKNITLALLLSVFSLTAFAQKGWHAGVQFGYYLTGIVNAPSTDLTLTNGKTNNPFTQFQAKYATSYGLAVGYGFIPMLGIQVELNIASQGQKAKGSWDSGEAVTRDVDLRYVQLPILLKFRTPGPLAHLYVLIGPQFNFLSSATITDSRKNIVVPDPKSHFNGTDEGIAFGLGVEFDVPKFFFNAGLRTYYGFSDATAKAFQVPDIRNDYQSSHNFYGGLNIGAHYKF